MKITIANCLDGAQKAEGITVVMDVFRASNTIIACLAQGALYVLPVEELEEAHQLKKEHPDHLLFGERKGLMPKGFDHGNGPADILKLDLKDKSVILTTSAGTKGIVHCKSADEILIGSFANAQVIVDYLKKKKPEKVTLLAIGESAITPATEDEECAKYIQAKLKGENPDTEEIKKVILKSERANHLRKLKQNEDLKFCLQWNSYNVIPQYNNKTGRITNINFGPLDKLIQKFRSISVTDQNKVSELLEEFYLYLKPSLKNVELSKVHHYIGLLMFSKWNFNEALKQKAERAEMTALETQQAVTSLSNAMNHLQKSIELKQAYLNADSPEIIKSKEAQMAAGRLLDWYAQKGPEEKKKSE